MFELRIVEHELGVRPEIQYRYKNQVPHGCIPPPDWKKWSEWITAPYVNAEEIE